MSFLSVRLIPFESECHCCLSPIQLALVGTRLRLGMVSHCLLNKHQTCFDLMAAYRFQNLNSFQPGSEHWYMRWQVRSRELSDQSNHKLELGSRFEMEAIHF